VVDFDQLIKNGELVKAARLFAKEGYENGEFGFTRKLLIESLANRVESLEKEKVGMAELVDDSVEISWKIEQQNKRYREAIKKTRYAIHTQVSSINHQENTELENQYIRGMSFSMDMINRYFEALEGEE